MPWDSSDRLARLPKNWDAIRSRVFKTKGTKCLIKFDGCEIDATDVDHIVRGDDHTMKNLRPACSRCHQKKSSAEGNEVKKKMKAVGKRPVRRHPGGQ